MNVQPDSGRLIFTATITLGVEEENKPYREIKSGSFLSSESKQDLEIKINRILGTFKELVKTDPGYVLRMGKVEEVYL